jgi:Protein of unknown function (DUF3105)
MSQQREARRRRREERRLQRMGPEEPQKQSLFDRVRDFLQHNWVPVAGGVFAIGFVGVLVFAIVNAEEGSSAEEEAEQAETDDSTDLPGEFVTSAGRQHTSGGQDVEYETTPPTSGLHDPVPLPPATIYRDPADAPEERAVHSMEHASVVLWYNCEAGGLDEAACDAMIDDLVDRFVEGNTGNPNGGGVLIINYPQQDNLLSVTSWTRLARFEEYDDAARAEIQEFIDAHLCRFDPEGVC